MTCARTNLRLLTRIAALLAFPLINQFLSSVSIIHDLAELRIKADSLLAPTTIDFSNRGIGSRENWGQKPRMLQMVPNEQPGIKVPATDRMIGVPRNREEKTPRLRMIEPLCGEPRDPDCVIPGTWQEENHVACNLVHEIDLNHFDGKQHGENDAEHLRIVAQGGKRLVLRFREFDGTAQTLKMFRFRIDHKEDFGPGTIELQRRDALVHEVTSSSPFVVNIHGYCGASAIFDFGDGGQLEANIRRDGPIPRNDVLRVAHHVAASVADVHHPDESGRPTIAHSDIHAEQWIMVDGKYQLTDFNLAKLLKRSHGTKSTVPFRRDVVANWFSPEVHRQQYTAQDIGTEKMDIWNMGNVLYLIFLGRPPFDDLPRAKVHSMIVDKQLRPEIPAEKRASKDYVDQIMVRAIDMCLKQNPEERPTAQEVADFLEASATPAPKNR